MRVLLVNDDGPPAPASPHILGLYETLRRMQPTWDVQVVLPSSQKSWGSMAFTLSPPCAVWYYYPKKGDYDGTAWERAGQRAAGEAGSNEQSRFAQWSSTRRPVQDDEVGEWVLVDGSPTTAANTGLYALSSLQQQGPDAAHTSSSSKEGASRGGAPPAPSFDLVLSGPNFGRNTGNAFSLCSGTIGAALAASLCGVRAISLSYAHFQQLPHALEEARKQQQQQERDDASAQPFGQLPPSATPAIVQNAHELACDIVTKLWATWESGVGVYTINIPLTFLLQRREQMRVYWARTWDSKFGPLYAVQDIASSSDNKDGEAARRAAQKPAEAPAPTQLLRFAPNMASMLRPQTSAEAEGTDIWAVENGHVSVARLSASYTAVVPQEVPDASSSSAAATAIGPGALFKL